MKKLDTLCDATAKKIVQHTLQSAMEGGPECPCLLYTSIPELELCCYRKESGICLPKDIVQRKYTQSYYLC